MLKLALTVAVVSQPTSLQQGLGLASGEFFWEVTHVGG